jgi:hypothetical protein
MKVSQSGSSRSTLSNAAACEAAGVKPAALVTLTLKAGFISAVMNQSRPFAGIIRWAEPVGAM